MERATELRLLVVGAGTMGAGIAEVAACHGITTLLQDTRPGQVDLAIARIGSNLERAVARDRMADADRAAALARITRVEVMEDAAETADFVVETIVEDVAAKQLVLATLAGRTRPDVALASNTSAISITELAAATGAADRVVGMHFFNPVPRMRLVEVIRGLESGDAAVAAAKELAARMDKRAVEVADAPGFVVTRINALIGNEAFRMLEGGVASAEDIDEALRLGLNHPMGPFELGDLVGWDVRLSVLEYLNRTLGDRYLPSPLLVRYVKAGRLGRKTGRGVYGYD